MRNPAPRPGQPRREHQRQRQQDRRGYGGQSACKEQCLLVHLCKGSSPRNSRDLALLDSSAVFQDECGVFEVEGDGLEMTQDVLADKAIRAQELEGPDNYILMK